MESIKTGQTEIANKNVQATTIKKQFKAIFSATILAISALNCTTEKQLHPQTNSPATIKYEGPDKDDSCCQECTTNYDTKVNKDGTLTYKTFYPETEMHCQEYATTPNCKTTLQKHQTKIINCR